VVDEVKKAKIKLKFLADCFYGITDKKNMFSEKLKKIMSTKIDDMARKISTSRKIL
jgi:hypothetical protein